jgi:hypothetical protein
VSALDARLLDLRLRLEVAYPAAAAAAATASARAYAVAEAAPAEAAPASEPVMPEGASVAAVIAQAPESSKHMPLLPRAPEQASGMTQQSTEAGSARDLSRAAPQAVPQQQGLLRYRRGASALAAARVGRAGGGRGDDDADDANDDDDDGGDESHGGIGNGTYESAAAEGCFGARAREDSLRGPLPWLPPRNTGTGAAAAIAALAATGRPSPAKPRAPGSGRERVEIDMRKLVPGEEEDDDDGQFSAVRALPALVELRAQLRQAAVAHQKSHW